MGKDQILQALLKEGNIRIFAISAKTIVSQAKALHSLSRVCTAALGRQLMATAMMAQQLKHPTESLTAITKGNGPVGNLVCTGRYGAHVKGYASNPGVELPLTKTGKLNVSGAVGRTGKLTVVRDMFLKEPWVGTVDLVSGEIAEDFAQYFIQSEGQPSVVYLGVRIRPQSGDVLSAGGLIAQPMPGCPEEYIDELEIKASEISTLAEQLELAPLEDVLYKVFNDMDIELVGSTEPLLHCDCSRERTSGALIALGGQELQEMIDKDNGAELTCQFCNVRYEFSKEQLEGLLQEARRPRVKEKDMGTIHDDTVK